MGGAGFVFWGAFAGWVLVIAAYVIWLWRVER